MSQDALTPFLQPGPEGGLQVQRCEDCALLVHPPTSICYRCDGRTLSFAPVSGKATLYSWTWVHREGPEHVAGRKPYLVAQVELDEQPGLLMFANLPSVDEARRLRTGMPLIAISRGGDELPEFAPAELPGGAA